MEIALVVLGIAAALFVLVKFVKSPSFVFLMPWFLTCLYIYFIIANDYVKSEHWFKWYLSIGAVMTLTGFIAIVISGTTSKLTQGRIGALELLSDYKDNVPLTIFTVLMMSFIWPLVVIGAPIAMLVDVYSRVTDN